MDAPLSMYLQPGSSTSSVQGYRCPTAQVFVNSRRLRADYSHDARLEAPRRPPLQPLTKVQHGPVAGLSGWCGCSGGHLGPTLTSRRVQRARRPARAAGGVVLDALRGERRGPPRWRRARAAAASVIRSVHRDPCKCTARSSNPRCSEKHWAPTLPNARSARAGLHSSPAGFAQFACTVRTDDTLLRATLMWVLEPRSLRSRNEFSRISSHSGTERVSAYHKG